LNFGSSNPDYYQLNVFQQKKKEVTKFLATDDKKTKAKFGVAYENTIKKTMAQALFKEWFCKLQFPQLCWCFVKWFA
jgi:hypothetical protein